MWQSAVKDAKTQVVIAEQPSSTDSSAPNNLASMFSATSQPSTPAATSPSLGLEALTLTSTTPPPPPKLTPVVTLIPRTDPTTTTQSGYLSTPLSAHSDSWARRWFALRRPFLYVYESNAEIDEIMVINVSSVRWSTMKTCRSCWAGGRMFSVFTQVAIRTFLQAKDKGEMEKWMGALDSLYREE